jgi:hypothetical protein
MSNWYYTKLIAPIIQSLCAEVMVLGLFVVGFSYIRIAIVNRHIFRQGYFWRQVLLLASVTLFCVYTIISYNVEPALHVSPLKRDTVVPLKLFFLIMPMIDVMLIGISGAMFVCMSLDSFMPEEENDYSSSTELSVLLLLSFAWHLVCILWWLMWIGSSVFDTYNIWYHFFVVVTQCASLTGWRMIVHSVIYIEHKETCEWCGVAWYALVSVIIYCTRMIYYVDDVFNALSHN